VLPAGLTIALKIVTGSQPWGRLYEPDRPAPEDFHQSGDMQSLIDDMALVCPLKSDPP
jgi:hypothetical protein